MLTVDSLLSSHDYNFSYSLLINAWHNFNEHQTNEGNNNQLADLKTNIHLNLLT